MNLGAASLSCNQYKADRTPEEAGMKLLVTPYVPKPEASLGAPDLAFA